MDDDLAAVGQFGREEMRVQIADQEQGLEIHDARVPDRRASTKERQHHLREHGLDEEDQRCSEQDAERKQGKQPTGSRGRNRRRSARG